MMSDRLQGLVAATHTPFTPDGELNVEGVEGQAAHLARTGVGAVFIGGTTGESHSLTVEERLLLAQRWSEVVRGSSLRLIIHVGANCLSDSRALAAQAQGLGAAAISALSPSYFKPQTVDDLIACCVQIAGAAPELPFYYYDIPAMTGVRLSMPAFLERAAERIPTLAGIKFTNPDLVAYQCCLRGYGDRFDLPFGIDECLLAALALGAGSGIGSSYNFAAPLYLRLMDAFNRGDLDAAREEQYRSVQIIQLLAEYGYLAASKAVMSMVGAPVGRPRLPNGSLKPGQHEELQERLQALGFFEWAAC